MVREKVRRYSSVSEENEREGTESSFMREVLLIKRERYLKINKLNGNIKGKKERVRVRGKFFTLYGYCG